MNVKELINQLKSLKVNQADFVAHDETGIFEKDIIALELAIKIIEENKDNMRVCSDCGKLMTTGYCIENGLEYYCSDECLHKHYTNEEYINLYDDGNGDSYHTEWENYSYE